MNGICEWVFCASSLAVQAAVLPTVKYGVTCTQNNTACMACNMYAHGELAERLKALVLNTSGAKAPVSSNLTLVANGAG